MVCLRVQASKAAPSHTRCALQGKCWPLAFSTYTPPSTVPPVFFPGTLAKHWPPPWSLVCTHAELAARTVPADLKDFLPFSPGTLCTCAVAPSAALGPWPFIEQQASHVRVSRASSSPCAVGSRRANMCVGPSVWMYAANLVVHRFGWCSLCVILMVALFYFCVTFFVCSFWFSSTCVGNVRESLVSACVFVHVVCSQVNAYKRKELYCEGLWRTFVMQIGGFQLDTLVPCSLWLSLSLLVVIASETVLGACRCGLSYQCQVSLESEWYSQFTALHGATTASHRNRGARGERVKILAVSRGESKVLQMKTGAFRKGPFTWCRPPS